MAQKSVQKFKQPRIPQPVRLQQTTDIFREGRCELRYPKVKVAKALRKQRIDYVAVNVCQTPIDTIMPYG